MEGKTTRRAPIIGLGIVMDFKNDGTHPRITQVTMGTGAEAAGIKPNDILLSVDGNDALSHVAITRSLIRHRAGDIVDVIVERDGKEIPVKVEIRAFKDEQ
jgi:S1-C subfamily serine protease